MLMKKLDENYKSDLNTCQKQSRPEVNVLDFMVKQPSSLTIN